jgi:dTDP-4-dehydrorhamnose reductase
MAAAARRILVTGGTGQVGHELLALLAGPAAVWAPTRAELDLASESSIRDAVRDFRPSAICNAGAYTAVDRAESDVDLCRQVNAVAPGILAEEAARTDAALVHFSTDYVFDGSKERPWTEADEPNPLGVYGQTKLEGERAVLRAAPRGVVLRCSWVYGVRGSNFLLTMVRLGREMPELRVVDDQVGAPTWSRSIAAAVVRMLPEVDSMRRGIDVYHLSAAGSTTWFHFAAAIFEGIGVAPALLPISTADYGAAARRPANSVLDNTRVREHFGISLPHWRADLAHALRAL